MRNNQHVKRADLPSFENTFNRCIRIPNRQDLSARHTLHFKWTCLPLDWPRYVLGFNDLPAGFGYGDKGKFLHRVGFIVLTRF